MIITEEQILEDFRQKQREKGIQPLPPAATSGIESQLEKLKAKVVANPPVRQVDVDSKIESLRYSWAAPLRHVGAEIERKGEWGNVLTRFEYEIGKGFLFALIGERGRGKTQLAVELMRCATARLKSARYVSATEFFMSIKATYKKESHATEKDVIAEFRKPRLLVIDEIHRRGDTDWEDRLLFELIDKRYQDQKDTLLVSNQERQDFIQSIGTSLASRMKETGGICEAKWESYR